MRPMGRALFAGAVVAAVALAWWMSARDTHVDAVETASDEHAAPGEDARLTGEPPKEDESTRAARSGAPGRAGATEPIDDRVTGTVVDASGAPVEGAKVVHAARSATTDGQGAFALPPATFRADGSAGDLVARRPGHGAARVTVRREAHRDLRVILPPTAEVSGRVTSEAGPIPDATVTWRQDAAATTTSTGPDGRFGIDDATSLKGVLEVTAKGFFPEIVEVPPSVTPRLLTVRLAPAADVAVKVVDGEGSPVRGAKVTLHWGWQHLALSATSDATGFALRAPTGRQDVALDAQAQGRRAAWKSGPFAADTEVVLVLEPAPENRLIVHGFGVSREELASWSVALASNNFA